MKILISGSSGLVGSALIPYLREKGHEVFCLVRRAPKNSSMEIFWNLEKGEIDKTKLEGIDIVIHLAGENIASGRWTAQKKQRLRSSRVESTKFLCQTLLNLKTPPQMVLSASAVGFYGDRGTEILHEESHVGKGFLAELACDWESAWDPLVQQKIRVVNLRFGMILSSKGGALTEMKKPFTKGLGAIFGNGKQYWSWIHMDDVLGAIDHVLPTKHIIRGPLNVVAPHSVTQKEFAKTLGQVLHRPVFLRVPSFALKIIFGEMAEGLFLSSARAEPARLGATSYKFKYPNLELALKNLLA